MGRICEICHKGTTTGNNVSHSERKTKRKWLANLQKVKVLVDDKYEKITVCTKCLKTLKHKNYVKI